MKITLHGHTATSPDWVTEAVEDKFAKEVFNGYGAGVVLALAGMIARIIAAEPDLVRRREAWEEVCFNLPRRVEELHAAAMGVLSVREKKGDAA